MISKFFFLVGGIVEWNRVHCSEVMTDIFYHAQKLMDDDECEAIVGMLGRVNRSIRRKTGLVPLCAP
jgi:hypothetical protein